MIVAEDSDDAPNKLKVSYTLYSFTILKSKV